MALDRYTGPMTKNSQPTKRPTPALVPVNRGKRLSAPVYTTTTPKGK
jgi:hypothetical protein